MREIAANVVLRPGEVREFVVPDDLKDEIVVTLRGYYQPLRFDTVAEKTHQ
jgi:hypothetical protein